jgi:hypothetical protein
MIKKAVEKKQQLLESLQYSSSLADKGEKLRAAILECEDTILRLTDGFE